MEAPHVVSWPIDALPDDARAEATRRAKSAFQTPGYAEAMAAAGPGLRLVRVERDGVVIGHATVWESAVLGFRSWFGVGEPALRDGEDPLALWTGLLREARTRGVVSAAWRESATTRVDPDSLAAARLACARGGARVVVGECGTYSLPLEGSDDEALWTRVDRKHRNVVRAAERAGVQVGPAPPEGFAKAYATLSDETFARSGVRGPSAAYFERLVTRGALDGTVVPYLARDATGAAIGGAVVTAWNGAATYLHGASADAAPTGTSALLQWRAIQNLRARGARTYDLGGVAIPGSLADFGKAQGLRRFKEKFGGALQRWPTLMIQVHPRFYRVARRHIAKVAKQRQKQQA